MQRLQDGKGWPVGMQPAGVRSIYGGLAGVGQDISEFMDPFAGVDFGPIDLGPFDPGSIFGSPSLIGDATFIDPFELQLPVSDIISGGETVLSQGDTMANLYGFPYGQPGEVGVDAAGYDYTVGPDGSALYADGTKVFPGGETLYPNEGFVDAAGNYYPLPPGTYQSVSAQAAAGGSWTDILNTIKAALPVAAQVIQVIQGRPQVPAGARPGQVYKGSDGQYYRVNADGTTTVVPAPVQAAGNWTPILLLGGGALLLMTMAGRRKAG